MNNPKHECYNCHRLSNPDDNTHIHFSFTKTERLFEMNICPDCRQRLKQIIEDGF